MSTHICKRCREDGQVEGCLFCKMEVGKMVYPIRFIEFGGAIIGLDRFCHASVRSEVTEKKDTCWELRIYMGDGEHGLTWDYDTESEAKEAYNELSKLLTRASSPDSSVSVNTTCVSEQKEEANA